MLNVFKFMKLDYLVIKKQLVKAILLMIIALAIIIVSANNIEIITFYPLFLAVITVSYPFIFTEKNNMDDFYATLAMNKSTVVKGRYIFTILIAVIFAILSAILTIVCSKMKNIGINNNTVILNSVLIMVITIVLAAIQMPMYFKFGYTKARIWTYVPFFAIAAIAIVVKYIPEDILEKAKRFINAIQGNSLITVSLMILVSLLILEISAIVSQKIYINKEA